jgi:glycosyltransferase involved in cell wall biosynthesis
MKMIRILVDSFADEGLLNAQMSNAREIIRRLDPALFHISTFCVDEPDPHIADRPNTRLIRLPRKGQTVRIFREFVLGTHEILFYVKASPASKWYLRLRRNWKDNRITVGTVESRCDLRNEPTIAPKAVSLWEHTVLRCDYLFSNSRAVRQSLQSEYGLKSQIVPTGVDTKFFEPLGNRPPNVRPRVLFVGSLRPFKQPQLLLDAALRFREADFVIAGDGPMASQLKDRIQHESIGNVRLAGSLGAEQLRREYQQADVFLFPSLWEGSPKVVLEATACALPVIARKDYEPETIINGQTGYLVACDQELFQRLEELLRSPKLRQEFGVAGREHSKQFDWDVLTSCWQEIFRRLTSKKARSQAA